MRKYLILSIYLIHCAPVFAQTHLNIGYYDFNMTSRNFVLWVDKTFKQKHTLGIGIKYHLDDPIRSDFSQGSYYRTISSEKWYEPFGFMLQYQRKLPLKNDFFDISWFYNFQGTYGFVKASEIYLLNSRRWIRGQFTLGELLLWENQVGLTLNIHLTPKINCYFNAGIGMVFYWDFYNNQLYQQIPALNVTSTSRDFDRMLSVGIQYELIPAPQKTKFLLH